MRGGFAEITRGGTTECAAGTVVYRPSGHSHRNAFGWEGGLCLNLELGEGFLSDSGAVLQSPFISREAQILWHDVEADHAPLVAEGIVAILSGRLGNLRLQSELRAPQWLMEVRDKLTDEFRSNHTLAELTLIASVHPVHLSREFHRFFGCSTGGYLRRLRLNYAHRLVAGTNIPLAKIALEAGFADHPHFTRAFKQAFGMAPSEIRSPKTLCSFKPEACL